ncbi:expressed protein [Phakopsora pachyrhizi]|uniref:Expressed protein n=1 Tax=Phakopsora pachyrhizi TaxID=170000 RepID=A0AAV0B9W0_PHAPC|nr:expressed protein [Phakopsora pachyrhizi]
MIASIFSNLVIVSLICLGALVASDPDYDNITTNDTLPLNSSAKPRSKYRLYYWSNSVVLGNEPLKVINRAHKQSYTISDRFADGKRLNINNFFFKKKTQKKAVCGFGHVYRDSAGNRFRIYFKNLLKHHERWYLRIPQTPSRGNKTFSYRVSYNDTSHRTTFVDRSNGYIAASFSKIHDLILFTLLFKKASFISYITLLQKRKHRCRRKELNPFLVSLPFALIAPVAPVVVGVVQTTS